MTATTWPFVRAGTAEKQNIDAIDDDDGAIVDECFARGGLVPPSRSLPSKAESAMHVCLESLGQVLNSRPHRHFRSLLSIRTH